MILVALIARIEIIGVSDIPPLGRTRRLGCRRGVGKRAVAELEACYVYVGLATLWQSES